MTGQDIIEVIPRKYRPLLEQSLRGRWQALQEVRFRIGQAVEWYDGKKHRIDATRVTRMDMKEMMDYMSGYSLYAFEDEIAKGYLTIPGGHRVGVAGQVVVEEGKVKYIPLPISVFRMKRLGALTKYYRICGRKTELKIR